MGLEAGAGPGRKGRAGKKDAKLKGKGGGYRIKGRGWRVGRYRFRDNGAWQKAWEGAGKGKGAELESGSKEGPVFGRRRGLVGYERICVR